MASPAYKLVIEKKVNPGPPFCLFRSVLSVRKFSNYDTLAVTLPDMDHVLVQFAQCFQV